MVDIPKLSQEPALVESLVTDFCDLIVCVAECHYEVRRWPNDDSKKVTLEHANKVLKIALTRLLMAVGAIE